MHNFLELAVSRRSIRKFQAEEISDSELEYFIKCAISAPSGCNSQCWNFVAVRDREIIARIAEVVVAKTEALLSSAPTALTEEYLRSKRTMATFFTKAPVVMAVFMTKADFYDKIEITALKAAGYDEAGIMKLFANYDLLSIGAAIQNLLLAVHERGYGACWMNEPAVAGVEINQILNISLEQRFISLIPIGVPAYIPREKQLKDLGEVFSIR